MRPILLVAVAGVPLAARWLHYSTPGIPAGTSQVRPDSCRQELVSNLN
jgi:hypothetical protein